MVCCTKFAAIRTLLSEQQTGNKKTWSAFGYSGSEIVNGVITS